jgi:ATP phosphoribosyltransferase
MSLITMALPKGRIFQKVARLLNDASLGFDTNNRQYIPHVGDPDIEAKIMKPQNIAQLIELGSHDIGFTGYDWIVETGADIIELMDLTFDPVKIVSAVPEEMGKAELKSRKILVATEYEKIATQYLQEKGFSYFLIRTFGATEAYPPQDADMIIDNTATGQTLKDHKLKVVDEIMASSTRFIANSKAMLDGGKKEKIEELVMLFQAVLNARSRVMLEMNVPPDKLDEIVAALPCMRAPTVAPLFEGQGYAVKSAVKREETVKLIPQLKKLGATDILEYEFKKVII